MLHVNIHALIEIRLKKNTLFSNPLSTKQHIILYLKYYGVYFRYVISYRL